MVPIHNGHDPNLLSETYTRYNWIDLPEYEETCRNLYNVIKPYVVSIAGHIDQHMESMRLDKY